MYLPNNVNHFANVNNISCLKTAIKTNKRIVDVFKYNPQKFQTKKMSNDFYLRYYVGHKGKFGHEFLEFEFRPDGKLRYANNSNYKNDTMIRLGNNYFSLRIINSFPRI